MNSWVSVPTWRKMPLEQGGASQVGLGLLETLYGMEWHCGHLLSMSLELGPRRSQIGDELPSNASPGRKLPRHPLSQIARTEKL